MESPVVLDKPPEYHGNDRGFPFEDAEGSDAWSELAARHPDIAARLRQRPASATWARKRRPSSQDATDDFGDNFGGFDRFAFDDFPPEFREHLPSSWNRRFGSREEAPPQPPPAASPPPQPPQHQTAGTQTESNPETTSHLPQYGLRNTVDLGQKSPADPSLVDAEERTHRSVSAPPDARPPPPDMSAPHPHPEPHADAGNVRVIPIFVEGRDEPVINKHEHSKHPAPPAPAPAPAPADHKPAFDRDQYFADDAGASFHCPQNFSRTFGTPNTKGFRQPPQPFQQKVYPQNFARGASPQRSQSPKQPAQEHFAKVPAQPQHAAPRPATPQQPPPPPPEREQTPPHAPPKPCANDPITQILSIQTDVLNLMTEVENFTSTKKDKRYLFLDEMLTRNLIKLDNIETDGKENIRLARKEAIRCIQKCIAVLEAKAEKNGCPQQPTDVNMKDTHGTEAAVTENGEDEIKGEQAEPQADQTETKAISEEAEPTTEPQENHPAQEPEAPPVTDLQADPSEDKPEEQNKDKPSPKKMVVKKRDKSKDKARADSAEPATDSNKVENVDVTVDNKGDKTEQVMEVDGAASQ